MYRVGDRVKVDFDLAERLPFLKHAPITATGTVKVDGGGPTVRVYVHAVHEKTEYFGSVDVPREKVRRIDSSR